MTLLRTRRLTALVAALSILLGACGSSTPSPDRASPSAARTSFPPGSSANLRMVVDADPSALVGLPPDEPGKWISRLTNVTLYAPNDRLEMVPMAAADMPATSKDGLTWTVKVRPGVMFADGTALTAADVVFSYQLVASRNCGQDPDVCSAVYGNLASVSAPNASTVVFKLRAQYAPFLVSGLGTVPILPKAAVSASLSRLLASARGTDPKAVQAESDRIANALADAACTGDVSQPDTCNQRYWSAGIVPILTKAGVALPQEAAFAADDGTVDQDGYGQALIDRLDALAATLAATGTDQAAAALDLLDFAGQPVGAGPYAVSAYEPGKRIVLARNEHYWRLRVGPPQVDVEIIRDPAAASNALKQGDIDFLPDVSADALPSLTGDPGLRVSEFADFTYYFIAFNVRPGHVYGDLNLRVAFASCIDHDAAVATATSGTGVPIYAEVPPASWAYNASVPHYTDDVNAAKRLIESSGWTMGPDGVYEKDGKRLATTLYVRRGRPARLAFAQLASQQLRRCGIELDVSEADFSSTILPFLAYPSNFDTYLGNRDTSLDPDDYSVFASDQVPTKDSPDLGNLAGWKNAQADELLGQGRTVVNRAARKAIYDQFQALVHDQVPYYFLWADKAHRGYSRRISAQGSETIDLASPLDYWNIDAWVVNP